MDDCELLQFFAACKSMDDCVSYDNFSLLLARAWTTVSYDNFLLLVARAWTTVWAMTIFCCCLQEHGRLCELWQFFAAACKSMDDCELWQFYVAACKNMDDCVSYDNFMLLLARAWKTVWAMTILCCCLDVWTTNWRFKIQSLGNMLIINDLPDLRK